VSYTIGDNVLVRISFRVGNSLTDPITWILKVSPPNSLDDYTLTFGVDPELIKDAVGEYTWKLSTDHDNPDHAGRWDYWAIATEPADPAKASQPGFVSVDKGPFDV
jgi:hypothetical protein